MPLPSIHPSAAQPPPDAAESDTLLVLSDVHLGSDLNDLTTEGGVKRTPEIDDDLARLLDHYRVRPPVGRDGKVGTYRLVIAGDFIDFIGITMRLPSNSEGETEWTDEEREHGLGSAEDHASHKLRLVAERHANVFAALARFVDAGHKLTLVLGNHDLEMHWAGVQQEFRDVLRRHVPHLDEARVGFEPWFFFVEGLVYVEHGHQYDPYCATEHVMAPMSPLDPRRLMRGFSEIMLRYVVRPTRGLREHGHENTGVFDYIALGLRLGVRGCRDLVVRFVRSIVELLRLRRQHFNEAAQVLRAEHERRMGLLAEATRIGIDRLKALAALQAPPITRSIHGILASLLLDRIALGLFCGLLVVVAGILGAIHTKHWLWPLGSVLVAWGVAHRALTKMRTIDPREALVDRAGHLAQIFPVAFVVMGHTHIPSRSAIESPAGQEATYINVGSWAEEEADDSGHTYRAARTHLVIRRGEAGPEAQLLAWDTAKGAPKLYDKDAS
ncbi:MAG: metallophosphoesterase [Myxococcales bacterium]|nr:metallophosphoesterase [Myxococcales bacterium]